MRRREGIVGRCGSFVVIEKVFRFVVLAVSELLSWLSVFESVIPTAEEKCREKTPW